jgi:hypothetical protein
MILSGSNTEWNVIETLRTVHLELGDLLLTKWTW